MALHQMSDAAAHAVLHFVRRKFDKQPLVDSALTASAASSGGGGLHDGNSGKRSGGVPHKSARRCRPEQRGIKLSCRQQRAQDRILKINYRFDRYQHMEMYFGAQTETRLPRS